MIKLEVANRMLDAILKRGAEMGLRPISAVVVEPGCVVKAFQKEDGASMIRFEMAVGKCYAALALGRSSSLVRIRQDEKPNFIRHLTAVSDNQMFAEGGAMLIRNDNGDVIGAVGVTGDTEEHDEELAIHGIRSVGLKIDTDFEGKGRQFIVRRTAGADGR